jgi:hypothetical protein
LQNHSWQGSTSVLSHSNSSGKSHVIIKNPKGTIETGIFPISHFNVVEDVSSNNSYAVEQHSSNNYATEYSPNDCTAQTSTPDKQYLVSPNTNGLNASPLNKGKRFDASPKKHVYGSSSDEELGG